MRLLGRRLPDVLIGVLIVVLALGLGSLLLTQRNRAAVTSAPDQPTTTQPTTTQPPAAIPAAPGNTDTGVTDTTLNPPAAQPTTIQPTTTQPTATPPAATTPAQPSTTPTGTVQAPSTQTPTNTPPDTTVSPVTAPNTTAPGTLLPDASQAASGQTASSDAAQTAPPRSGGAVATSANRTPLRSDYRISLGTFGSVAEATTRTAAVKALGYTVYPIDLGTQVVAQVGPFTDSATANAALSDIRRAYGGAVLYAPRGSAAPGTPASSASTASGSSPAASSQNIPAAPASAPAPAGPVYLQVGAFDRQESAQKMVGMLGDLGFSPTVQAPEGKKVTVLIGPFTGPALTSAESKLSDNGLDHFRVR